MKKLKDEISEKKRQMHVLEQRMIGSVQMTPRSSSTSEMSQVISSSIKFAPYPQPFSLNLIQVI